MSKNLTTADIGSSMWALGLLQELAKLAAMNGRDRARARRLLYEMSLAAEHPGYRELFAPSVPGQIRQVPAGLQDALRELGNAVGARDHQPALDAAGVRVMLKMDERLAAIRAEQEKAAELARQKAEKEAARAAKAAARETARVVKAAALAKARSNGSVRPAAKVKAGR